MCYRAIEDDPFSSPPFLLPLIPVTSCLPLGKFLIDFVFYFANNVYQLLNIQYKKGTHLYSATFVLIVANLFLF